jgi:hypothetical protein
LTGGGCGVPKSRGAGDDDRECTDREVSSFMRLVLRTWRKRSVISEASRSASTSAECARWAAWCSMVEMRTAVAKGMSSMELGGSW